MAVCASSRQAFSIDTRAERANLLLPSRVIGTRSRFASSSLSEIMTIFTFFRPALSMCLLFYRIIFVNYSRTFSSLGPHRFETYPPPNARHDHPENEPDENHLVLGTSQELARSVSDAGNFAHLVVFVKPELPIFILRLSRVSRD